MVKLNNVVRVNTTNVKDFFVKWFVFLKPFHNLTNKEIDVMATFLKYRYANYQCQGFVFEYPASGACLPQVEKVRHIGGK